MFSTWPLLSLLIWLPILGGTLTLFFGDQRGAQSRSFALLVAIVTFALSLVLFQDFDRTSASMQFTEFHPWIPAFKIGYNVGVDGISIALIGLIYLYLKSGTFQLAELATVPLDRTEQMWLFFAFLAAFSVKVPMFPVHTWLPDAHVEAPTGGSVVLAAIMLKIGGYGFLRFSLPIVPDASNEFGWLIILLSLIAVVYIGFVALAQQDMKKLIAYSSIAHMGFVTLGTFIAFKLTRDYGNTDAARLGLQGAMVQMISHGFVSGAMFSCVGVLYDRMHSRMIRDYGGVVNTMPWFAALFVFFAMANAGLPGTSGFVGEFMVILAAFQQQPLIAFAAATTLILGAAYTLWMVKRVVFGDVANHHVAELSDINAREAWVLGIFALGVLAIGVYPKPLTDLMDASVTQLVSQLGSTKL